MYPVDTGPVRLLGKGPRELELRVEASAGARVNRKDKLEDRGFRE
jgi:hypothetical protein